MKIIVGLTFFALAVLVFGQDEEVVVADPLTRCLAGSSTNGVGNFTNEDCAFTGTDPKICETRISLNNNNLYLERKCKQLLACENNMGSNAKDCYAQDAKDKGVRTCYYCCNTDLCNSFDTFLQEGTLSPEVIVVV